MSRTKHEELKAADYKKLMYFGGKYHDKIVVGQDLYQIVPGAEQLIRLNEAKHIIPYSRMTEGKESCSFIYNKKEGCLAEVSFVGNNNGGDYATVQLPKEILMLRHERSLDGNDQINTRSAQEQLGFQLLGRRYAERLLGMLPQFNILSSAYYFDLDKGALGPSPVQMEICLKDLKRVQNPQGSFYEAYYNFNTGRLENIDPPYRIIYPGYYLVLLPEEKRLDPIAFAEKENKSGFTYLNEHPIISQPLPYYGNRFQTGENIPLDHVMDHGEMLVAKKYELLNTFKNKIEATVPGPSQRNSRSIRQNYH